MAYKEHKFIPHGSGGWKVQDQDNCNFLSGEGLLPSSWTAHLSAMSLDGRKEEEALLGLFYGD